MGGGSRLGTVGGVFPALRGGVTPEGWRRERGQLRGPQGWPSAISIHYHPLSSNLSIPIPFFGSIPIESPRCRWISTVWRGVAPDMGTDLKDAGRIAGALFHASCKGPGQWQPCIFSKPCMLKMWIDGLFIRWWERIVTNKHCRILMYICFFMGITLWRSINVLHRYESYGPFLDDLLISSNDFSITLGQIMWK